MPDNNFFYKIENKEKEIGDIRLVNISENTQDFMGKENN